MYTEKCKILGNNKSIKGRLKIQVKMEEKKQEQNLSIQYDC